jgi:hypothetical protein
MDDEKTLGQIAYEAYGDAREWKVFGGGAMPPWDAQDSDIAAAWERAAEAAAEAAADRS